MPPKRAVAAASTSARSTKEAKSVSTAGPATVVSSAPTFDLDAVPLYGRESEFEAVVSFVHARLQQEHGHVLFVFGACGCGKTSTVLRAMRSFHARPLPCDHQVRNHHRDEEDGATRDTSTGKRARTTSTSSMRLQPPVKTLRRETGVAVPGNSPPSTSTSGRPSFASSTASAAGTGSAGTSPHSAGHASSRTSTDTAAVEDTTLAKALFDTAGPGDMPYYYARYPALYAAVTAAAAPGASAKPVAQAHYVNCADLNPERFAAAIHDSMKLAYPRPSAAVKALMSDILHLPERCKKTRKVKGSSDAHIAASVMAAAALSAGYHSAETVGTASPKARSNAQAMPLQVVVLDEVEYVRPATRALLTELAAMSFHPSSRLALICISNQRDLVHVPQSLMEELGFGSYSEEQLRQIGMSIAQEEIHKRFLAAQGEETVSSATLAKPKKKGPSQDNLSAVGNAPIVTISPSLYQYIARRALLEYSGDVRQVAAMCRRVVYTAWEDWSARHTDKGTSGDSGSHQKLEAAVDAYCQGQRQPSSLKAAHKKDAITGATATAAVTRSSHTRNNVATSSSSSSAPSNGVSTATAGASTCAVTLANSMKVIKGAAVEDHLRQYIGSMPEQSIYLLSCLIVLALKHERDGRRAAMTVGAVGGGGRPMGASTVAGSTAMTVREARDLYMRFMSRQHFHSMNGSSVDMTLSSLADLKIITQPSARGNENVFSFSGTCSLEALEVAVVERGEGHRKEMDAAGLDGSVNRYAAALRELKTLTGLTF